MKRSVKGGGGVGFASILMIIMVLAFTCFGTLALVSARADQEFCNRSIKFNQDYYNAEAQIASRIRQIYDDTNNNEEEIVIEEPINNELILQVVIQFDKANSVYKQISHTVITNDNTDESSNTPNVWKGPQ